MNNDTIKFSEKPASPGRLGQLTMKIDGQLHTLSSDHMNYKALMNALKTGAWKAARDLISIKKAISRYSQGQIEIVGDEILYKGAALPSSALTVRIMAMLDESCDVSPLTKFLANLMENPSESARAELYLFLEACSLPITEDGHFLAYKVVRFDYKDKYTGTMDNSVGARPKMKREDCNPNRDETCSRGLHFSSRSYIKSFHNGDSDRLMTVKVNPRDVVSIPSDYNNAKGRACEYLILNEIDGMGEIKDNFVRTDGKSVEPVVEPVTKADKEELKAMQVANRSVKLTEKDVLEIRKMLKQDYKYPVIAARFGVHRRTIERIDKNEAWMQVKLDKKPKPQIKSSKEFRDALSKRNNKVKGKAKKKR